jgi:hypothetical protein
MAHRPSVANLGSFCCMPRHGNPESMLPFDGETTSCSLVATLQPPRFTCCPNKQPGREPSRFCLAPCLPAPPSRHGSQAHPHTPGGHAPHPHPAAAAFLEVSHCVEACTARSPRVVRPPAVRCRGSVAHTPTAALHTAGSGSHLTAATGGTTAAPPPPAAAAGGVEDQGWAGFGVAQQGARDRIDEGRAEQDTAGAYKTARGAARLWRPDRSGVLGGRALSIYPTQPATMTRKRLALWNRWERSLNFYCLFRQVAPICCGFAWHWHCQAACSFGWKSTTSSLLMADLF